jgi:hypothetical protein
MTAGWSARTASAAHRSTQAAVRFTRPATNQVAHSIPRESSTTASYGLANGIARSLTTASQYQPMSATDRARMSPIVWMPWVRISRVTLARST